MNAKEIREILTNEQVIEIMRSLGHEESPIDRGEELVFLTTICHNGAHWNLHWYNKSKSFHCFSECAKTFDLVALVKSRLKCNFPAAIEYICSVLNLDENCSISDLELDALALERQLVIKDHEIKRNPELPLYLLTTLKQMPYQVWVNEGITAEIQKEFQIHYFAGERRVIVPHYQWDTGQFIGALGRALDRTDKRKWLPVFEFNKTWNIYALWNNMQAIRDKHEIIITESEKSPMKARAMGIDNVVAISGHHFSETQMGILIQLVKEIDNLRVVIAFDRDIEYRKIKFSSKELCFIAKEVSVMPSYNCIQLGEKDCPLDKTPEIFWELYSNRTIIT